MKTKQLTIDELREFFTTSNAALDLAKSLGLFSGVKFDAMRTLHKIALSELKKDTPDLQKVYDLLGGMEALASK